MNIENTNFKKFLEEMIENQNTDQYEQEKYAAQKYNDLFELPEIIEKFTIARHYRILEMAIDQNSPNQINYTKFCTFIINQLEKGNLDINVLFLLIDPSKLSKSDLLMLEKCPFINHSIINIEKELIFVLNKELEAAKQEMANLKEKYEADIANLKEFQKKQLNQIKIQLKTNDTNHQKDFSDLSKKINDQLKAADTKHQKDISDLSKKINDQLKAADTKHQKDISDLPNQIKNQLKTNDTKLQNDLKKLETKLQNEISANVTKLKNQQGSFITNAIESKFFLIKLNIKYFYLIPNIFF